MLVIAKLVVLFDPELAILVGPYWGCGRKVGPARV